MATTSDAARILFDKLDFDYIQREMLGKQFETFWLDCKRKTEPQKLGAVQSDEKNFAAALSGFANTSGGVLLWGLDARKDANGVDIIQAELVPILGLKAFESRLRELESRIVERPVLGVDYKPIEIESGTDKGLLAVYIPQSQRPPHRSRKTKEFYIRAGDSFNPLDITMIEDLLGRRLRPALEFVVKQLSSMEFVVCIENTGEASARAPGLVFRYPEMLALTGRELDGDTKLTSCVSMPWYMNQLGKFCEFRDGGKHVIHQGQQLQIVHLRAVRDSPPKIKYEFEYHIFAEHMQPIKGTKAIQMP